MIPTKQDSLFKILNNPFKRPDRKRVLRLDNNKDYLELIYNSDYTIVSYLIRYIVQPKPIILCDLDNATINGLSAKTECELHPSIHRLILEKAVILAKSTYIPNN